MNKTLVTRRLCLKIPAYSDVKVLFHLCSNPAVNLYNPAGPHQSEAQSQSLLRQWIEEDWGLHNIDYYLLEEKKTGEFIGYTGLAVRPLGERFVLNLAYRIEPTFWRRGYVKEACLAVIEECYSSYNSQAVIMALTKANNEPSKAVALSLGFHYNSRYDHFEEEGDVYFFNVPVERSNQLLP